MSSAAGPSAASDDVLARRQNGVLIVTINRPQLGVAAFRERRDPAWQDR